MSTTRNTYHQTPAEMQDKVAFEAYLDEDGAYRWQSSGNVVPADYIFWAAEEANGPATKAQVATQEAASAKDLAKLIADMKANPQPVSAEERYEMEAAFGKDAVVVNIFTGERVQG